METKSHKTVKEEFQRNIYFCFIDCTKAFDCVDHNKLWKILKEMGGIGMGKTCKLKDVSFQCMTKFTIKKIKKIKNK